MVALTGCQPRTLWSWGPNSVGQLGIGTTTPIPVAEYKHLRDLASTAGDLWNELDRCRSYWEDWDDSNMVEEYLDRSEKSVEGLDEVVGRDLEQ
jgi:hypothetical protein